jgi:tRNA (guanine37-N1)-methyltransferase
MRIDWRGLPDADCPMRIDCLTLFPEIFSGYLQASLIHKAQQRQLLAVHCHQLRDWSDDEKHHKVDDRPYGGGPGMLLKVGPIVEAVEAIEPMDPRPVTRILLTPQGERLNQTRAQQLAQLPRLLLICGRYEGFDERVIDILQPQQLSIGDYVLNGGEVAALAVIDAVARLLPGVIGDEASHQNDSFSFTDGQLEFPQYTRPPEFRGHSVPEVLLSGDHEKIARWRAAKHRTNEMGETACAIDPFDS